MTMQDVIRLNRELARENRESLRRLREYRVGDRVRYLVKKSTFDKGGKRFSESVWTVWNIVNYNVEIERNGNVQFKKHWELKRI